MNWINYKKKQAVFIASIQHWHPGDVYEVIEASIVREKVGEIEREKNDWHKIANVYKEQHSKLTDELAAAKVEVDELRSRTVTDEVCHWAMQYYFDEIDGKELMDKINNHFKSQQ
jgi:hypothetical protein